MAETPVERLDKLIMEDDDSIPEDDSFEFPEDEGITDMLDQISLKTQFSSVTDRYFTPYYKLNIQQPLDDICIRIHSNRICMLTLAPSHPLLRNGVKIERISFKVTEKLDRAANKVSGKGKHGAQPLQESSNICIIYCDSGEKWSIKCCMMGKLIEVNETLVKDPQSIKEPPHKGGYLAIILPNIKIYEEMKKNLLSEQEYQQVVLERMKSKYQSEDQLVHQNCQKRSLEDDSIISSKDKIKKL
ncbi:protein Simiate [Fopius arisanus]|uniref:Fam206a protein n=1 Tax=Fopius arisanus TaxID=64838 RepID=A0A0C9RJQ5_9HYME|nr:PREDICTED: protein Simiate [Fopius arisanus]XP_011312370.1 PREDICTED: protein Simiate [Fopius arisanus]XP_011312371.1 PREDICTED: protein Simiate [Fopius arisanus]XP_011312372.1 PREDICTED: protein Simiate [Fopius arisanus]XP_011312373.1 PREDICTED: protein Simiate [Fopius arisanus]